ncbi:MAG: hypothetical protein RLZZ612_450 [Pseudomonadota bacterium]|jgi:hypothetical protein
MQAFHRALAHIKKIKAQMAELEAIGLRYQRQNAEVLGALAAKSTAHRRELVLFLDERLRAIAEKREKSLSNAQHDTAVRLICTITAALAAEQPKMADLHDRYSKTSLSDIANIQSAENKAAMADILQKMGGQMPERGDALVSPQAIRQYLLDEAARLRQVRQARQEARQAKRAAKQKSKAKPDSPQAQAIANQEQAEQTLKTLFRQIASRLHPDREPDEAERQRKTNLMSQANAAYERKDWVTLMQLQLQAEWVDPDHASRLSAQRLHELTLLLKQQAAALETERQGLQAKWSRLLQVPLGLPLTAGMLDMVLNKRRSDLEQQLEIEAADLALIQTDAGLKTVLNEQRKIHRKEEKQQESFNRFIF